MTDDKQQSRKISMRVDPQMDAQLDALQAALNVDMSGVIRIAVATLHAHAIRNQWIVEERVTGPYEDEIIALKPAAFHKL